MAETSTTDTRPLTDDEGVGSSPRSATSSQPQERSQPGDSNTFQSTRGGTPPVDLADFFEGPVRNGQNEVTIQFEESGLQVPEAALLRPQTEPLTSLPALEARRNFESRARPVQHGPEPDDAQQTTEPNRRSGSFGSDRSDGGVEHDLQNSASSSRASSLALNIAWEREGINSHCYRHIVTGEVFCDEHFCNAPQQPGPSADDIPDGWRARLRSESEEVWEYVHCTTGIVIDVPPKSLPGDVVRQFKLAALHGDLPRYCKALFEDDCIKYGIYRGYSQSVQWSTTKHPKIIENEMKAYVDNLKTNHTQRPEVTLLAGGQELPVDFQTAEIRQLSGILVVTDIDRALVSCLLVAYPEDPLLPFFIICHFLLRTLNEDETAKELVRQVQGWYRMFEPDWNIDRSWAGNHYDVIHDSDRCKVHFGYAQYLSTRPTGAHMGVAVRLSIFRISTKLTLVLIGTIKPDWDDIQEVAPFGGQFYQPSWWIPSVPAYLGLECGAHRDANVYEYLTRLLREVTVHVDNTGLPRMDDDVDTHRRFKKSPEPMIAFRLVMSTWRDGISYLAREMGYFWEQAIERPHVDHFTRLKVSKQYAETLHQDLAAWSMDMDGLLTPDQDQSGRRAMDELKDQLGQILAYKQEIGDTFQLLIGAIAIKDSEIQKEIAQESRLQARRSTALTALAAIYLPLSLTTGVFGMNVVEIEEGKPKYWAALAVAIGLLVVTLPFLVWVYLDKDDTGQKLGEPKVPSEHPVDSERRQMETDDGVLRTNHSHSFDAKPPDSVRRRTTRRSQMTWATTGVSRPGSIRKAARPEHMV